MTLLCVAAVGCVPPSPGPAQPVDTVAAPASASIVASAGTPAIAAPSASISAEAITPAATNVSPPERAAFHFDPVDVAPFVKAGCKVFPKAAFMDCRDAPALKSITCLGDDLTTPDWLTALSPHESAAICWKDGFNDIADGGCMFRAKRVVIVSSPVGFKVIDEAAGVLGKWGPPKTDEQFIAYAALFTGRHRRAKRSRSSRTRIAVADITVLGSCASWSLPPDASSNRLRIARCYGRILEWTAPAWIDSLQRRRDSLRRGRAFEAS